MFPFLTHFTLESMHTPPLPSLFRLPRVTTVFPFHFSSPRSPPGDDEDVSFLSHSDLSLHRRPPLQSERPCPFVRPSPQYHRLPAPLFENSFSFNQRSRLLEAKVAPNSFSLPLLQFSPNDRFCLLYTTIFLHYSSEEQRPQRLLNRNLAGEPAGFLLVISA